METLPIIVRQQNGIVTLGCIVLSIFVSVFMLACSLEPAGLRNIRAHVVDKGGVVHAEPSLRATRYCQYCHGINLEGGLAGEPSCLQCHGQRWQDFEPSDSFAPQDHVSDHGGFRHHPDFANPWQTCTACHGADLQGQLDEGTPSCYLCHDQKWAD